MTPPHSSGNRSSSSSSISTKRQQNYPPRQHSHMQATGRGDHGYPVNHAQAGPYPLRATSALGDLGLRQYESGATGAFLLSGGDRGSSDGMGAMGSASRTAAGSRSSSNARDGSYVEMAVARQCEREDCTVQPSYGVAWKKPRFCARHKLPGMMDVRNRRCEHVGCIRQPSYGQEGQRRQFCFTHKREGDVDVKSTRCKSAGCPKHAMYGRTGEMPQYCSTHKADDMVDVKKRRRCNVDGCDKRASYALEGDKAAFCSAHKKPGHVNVNNRRCEYHGCSRRPVFSIKGEKPRFCVAHKLDGMSDSRLNADSRVRGRAASRLPPPASAAHRSFGGQMIGRYSSIASGSRISGNSEPMFSAVAGHAAPGTHRVLGTSRQTAAAQATVSAAAAVIAAMDDDTRVDFTGHHQGDRLGRSGNGNDSRGFDAHGSGIGDRGDSQGVHDDHRYHHHGGGGGGGGAARFRDSNDSLMYDSLQQSRNKHDVGGWTSALLAPDRERSSWATHAQPLPVSATLAPSHGQGATWSQTRTAPMAAGSGAGAEAAATVVESSPEPAGHNDQSVSEATYHRMPPVPPLAGPYYMDDHNAHGILNNLAGGGGGGGGGGVGLGGDGRGGPGGVDGGDFFTSFPTSNMPFSSALREHAYIGGGGGRGEGGGGEMSWESARPRPPPLPAPLPPPSSWARGLGVNAAHVHRLAGTMPPPPHPNRLPSLLNRRAPLPPPPDLSYDDVSPRGIGAVGDGRRLGDGDHRSLGHGYDDM